jgi:hypothetical protein
MKWEVVARPQAEDDVLDAANWYDSQRAGLGDEFIEEILAVFDAIAVNPLLHCRRQPTKEHSLALSQPVSLSRNLRSDRREGAGNHCRCYSRRST